MERIKIMVERNAAVEQHFLELRRAIQISDIEETKRLIDETNYEKIITTDGHIRTAIHIVTEGINREVCELLLSKISNATNSHSGMSVLHYAAFNGYKGVCEQLLSLNSEAASVKDHSGKLALHYAAFAGHEEICKLLIPKMSLEAINVAADGCTALHNAAEVEHKYIYELLVRNMYTLKVVELLKLSYYDSPIHNITVGIVTSFIKDKFSESQINQINFDTYEIKLLQLFQIIEHSLLFHLDKVYINNANNFIAKNYFGLINVCKSISEDHPIEMLINNDCLPHILNFLAPHSLCPELFVQVKMSGENVESDSINIE